MTVTASEPRRHDAALASTLLVSVAFVVVYFLTARAGLRLAYYQRHATLIWAPSGLAVAAVWRFGPRLLPAVFIAALTTNFSIGSSLALASMIAVGNTAEAAIAFALGRRAGLREGIRQVRDVPAFVGLAVVASTLVAAVNGSFALRLLTDMPTARMIPTALIWWLGDAGGVLVVTPLIMSFLRSPLDLGRRGAAEIALLAVLLVMSSALAFGGLLPVSWRVIPIALFPFPALAWAGGRFGMRGSTATVAIVTIAAVAGTTFGTGPFHYGNVHVDVAMLWLFVATMAASSMLLATSLEERSREVIARREGDEWLALALEAGDAVAFERDLVANVELRRDPSVRGATLAGPQSIDSWIERIDVDDRPGVREAIEACRTAGHDAWECEYRVSGRCFLERARIIERSEQGAPLRAVGLRRDITAHRRADDERRALERDLEKTQRLGELGMLAGGIAHDFNNLLTIIRVNNDLVRTTRRADVRTEATGAVEEATARAADLTEQLLAYAGRKPLSRRDVNLAQLCAETVRMLGTNVPDGITLQADVDAQTPLIEGDPAQLRQVLMNLLWNALEAMEGRTGRVTVRLHATEGRSVNLQIEDEGTGMDDATRRRVFEPFFSTKPRGRGLGMAAVLGIVRSHGGAIDVASEPGKGTTFSIQLPATDRLPRPSSPVSPARESVPAAQTPAQRRVLIVDDEAGIRSVARMFLEDSDYVAVEAASGDEAARCLAASGPFDLVLLDMTLPGESGIEIMKRLANKDPSLRFVLMSGYSEDLVHGRVPADVPFLAKPFRGGALVDRVKQIIG